MKQEEAVNIIASKYPNKDIDKVIETEHYFLVSLVPKNDPESELIRLTPCDDGLKAIEKSSKKIFTYNPIRHGK